MVQFCYVRQCIFCSLLVHERVFGQCLQQGKCAVRSILQQSLGLCQGSPCSWVTGGKGQGKTEEDMNAAIHILFSHHFVFVHPNPVKVLKEVRGNGHLEFLGVELDAVAGYGVVEVERKGNVALVLLDHGHQVFAELLGEHGRGDVHAESGEDVVGNVSQQRHFAQFEGVWRRFSLRTLFGLNEEFFFHYAL